MDRPMIDSEHSVPQGLEHDRFSAVPLTGAVAALDFECYVASPDVIATHSDGRWPTEGFTFEDDLALVAQHAGDHLRRRAFTFSLLHQRRNEALGCLYVNSLHDYLTRAGAPDELLDDTPHGAAMVTFWLRQDQQDTGLAEPVVEAVDDWLRDDWPLPYHLFRVLPGERSSRRALDSRGLSTVRLALSDDTRPYLWYRGSQ